MIKGFINSIICKLKGHKENGVFQGFVADVFMPERCCSCGAHLRTWEEVFEQDHTLEQKKEFDKKFGTENGIFKKVG